MPFWPQGLGESSGDSLITQGSFQTTGTVWYLHNSGSDANDGRNRVRPVATLAHAISIAAALDTIVCLDGHTENLDATPINKDGLTIVGAGTSGGKPTVKFTPANESGSCISIQQPGVRLRNLWFTGRFHSNALTTILIANSGTDPNGCELDGCYLECNSNDLGKKLLLGAGSNYFQCRNTTFICTADASTTEPLEAIGFSAAVTPYAVRFTDVTFDGGADGFSNFWAFDSNAAGVLRALLFERVSLLNGADMRLATTALGTIQVSTAQGGARVDWT